MDQKTTEIFIKEMKFLFFFMASLQDFLGESIKNMFLPIFPQALAEYLRQFNSKSLISN